VSAGALLLVFVAAMAGGAINSIAGGGTPSQTIAGKVTSVPPVAASATNTVALWPGALGSMWAYRGELSGARAWLVWFTAPSVLGGLLGALLLLHTDEGWFDAIVPFLVLGATVLFVLQRPLAARFTGRRPGEAETAVLRPPSWRFLAAQLGVGIYGGYFGAGIGILMLAALGAMGLANIHRMNGLKNWGAVCINAVAAVTFVAGGIVVWPVAAAMAAGGIAGGYGGARLALKVGQARVRHAVVAIGLAASLWLLVGR
jgi:uncharacterized protein